MNFKALTNLYNTHGQPRLFRQLFPDMPRRFRRLREGRLQYLQLFRFDRGPGPPTFRTRAAVVRTLVLRLGIPRLRVTVQRVLVLRVVLTRFRILKKAIRGLGIDRVGIL